MPDGNIFSAEGGPKHLVPGMPSDGSDLGGFMAATYHSQTEAWWRAHLDVGRYLSFHALTRVAGRGWWRTPWPEGSGP